MASGPVARCPHCRRLLRLAVATRFRCRWPGCGWEFEIDEVRPRPEYFGLTEEQVHHFAADVKTGPREWLIGAVVALFTLFGLVDHVKSGVALLLTGGFVFVSALALIEQIQKRLRQKHPDYAKFLCFRQLLSQFFEFRAAALAQRAAQLKAMERQRLETLRMQERWWKTLDGHRFEEELTNLLRARLPRIMCQVRRTGGAGDSGVDLEITNGNRRVIIQCKAHAKYISPGMVRDLYGALLHHHADEAWLVATSGFHRGAKEFAKGKPIRLVTIRDLLERKDLEQY